MQLSNEEGGLLSIKSTWQMLINYPMKRAKCLRYVLQKPLFNGCLVEVIASGFGYSGWTQKIATNKNFKHFSV